MSKSIIVINTPTNCSQCPLSYYNECFSEHYCRHSDYWKTITDYDYQRKAPIGKDVRPDWCPLKPLPEKQYVSPYGGHCMNQCCTEREKGWNDCIDYIEEKK